MSRQTAIEGGCHCGRIRYTLFTRLTPQQLPYRACTCSYCRRQGAVYTSDPEARLDIQCSGPVGVYQFAGKDVEFVSCPACGVLSHVLYKSDDRVYAVLNANTFEDIPADRQITLKTFTDESREAARQRRQQNWIGQVTFNNSSASKSGDKGKE